MPEETKPDNAAPGAATSTRATRRKVVVTEEPISTEEELIEEIETRLTDSTYRMKAETVVFAIKEMARLVQEGKIKL